MNGITKAIRMLIEGKTSVNLKSLISDCQESKIVDEEGVDFRDETYKSQIVSSLNAMDFYATGNGDYTYIEFMTEAQLKKVKDRLVKVIKSMRKTVKKLDGQISFLEDGSLNIPEPVKIEKEKES